MYRKKKQCHDEKMLFHEVTDDKVTARKGKNDQMGIPNKNKQFLRT
jgi:hypothetical protein